MESAIVWFRQDLRLHDNEALFEAIRNSDYLVPVYVFNSVRHRVGEARIRFLVESIIDLRQQLRALGSDLIVRSGQPDEVLYQLALETKSQWVYCNRERTRDEVNVQDRLEQKLWTIGRELRYSRGKMLYHTADLPFPITHCPDAFANFRKEVENAVPVRYPLELALEMPPVPENLDPGFIPAPEELYSPSEPNFLKCFDGGETAGLTAMNSRSNQPVIMDLNKQDAIIGPWISMGCLSPKTVYLHAQALGESGKHICQNLIYRDYLRMMGKKYGDRIFFRSGITKKKYTYTVDDKAFSDWKNGTTAMPIIDAAMTQLNRTGWMPDVLRKIVANYLIKVLKLDWRLGAAYFEYKLIDYDPCSNWVSWMNLAGVGPDNREDRTIHYDLISKKLDPEETYLNTWLNG
jgi:deoxyribodipyrimidine photo-lyase